MTAGALEVAVEGVAVLGPGLDDWSAAGAVLRGEQAHVPAPCRLPAPDCLPPAERRRSGAAVRVALHVGAAACAEARRRPGALAAVFAASGGDGDNCHAICEALASEQRLISPTRFHNSVHNAPAGYWAIAMGATAPSTSLSAYDGSFAAGLLEAAAMVGATSEPVLLVAYDTAYPEPLHAKRPLPDACAIGLVLAPQSMAPTALRLRLALSTGAPTALALPALERLRRAIPAARGLTLLAALARGAGACRLEYLPPLALDAHVAAPDGH
ncbi:MAG: beta-ketoacyl synthase chain length factor [Betaproteobacteria bacterium]